MLETRNNGVQKKKTFCFGFILFNPQDQHLFELKVFSISLWNTNAFGKSILVNAFFTGIYF